MPVNEKKSLTHQKGSARLFILWYNIIVKNIKPDSIKHTLYLTAHFLAKTSYRAVVGLSIAIKQPPKVDIPLPCEAAGYP